MSRALALNYCPNCGHALEDREAFGRVRRFCPACQAIVFREHKVAAGVLVEHEGRVLLVRRRIGPRQGLWTFPAGFVEWTAGEGHTTSYAHSVAPPDHWDLHDLIAIVSTSPKVVGSTHGHGLADTSFLHAARVGTVRQRLAACKEALLARDLAAFGPLVEEDALAMHAVMLTSRPPVFYWLPETVAVMRAVHAWRAEGAQVYFTIDAGPNVHCLCLPPDHLVVEPRLRALPGVLDVLSAPPGPGARLQTTD